MRVRALPRATAPVVVLQTDLTPDGVDDALCAELEGVRALLGGLPGRLVGVSSRSLASIAASAAGVVAAAEAARAAVVLEAHARGVINASDHPRTRDWIERSCVEAGVPVAKAQARQLQDIATDCDGHDLAALRAAVTQGRVPMESAALVAQVFRRLKKRTDYNNWDDLLAALITWACGPANRHDLAAIEDLCLSQWGKEEALDDEHAALHDQRVLTLFRRDRAGMMSATVKFDPASEAVFTAAIHALAKPQPDPDGTLDPRSPGQRRADALLTLAKLATTPDKDVRGSGAAARVIVTIPLSALLAGLDLSDRLGGAAPGDASATRGGAGHCCDERCAHPFTGACTRVDGEFAAAERAADSATLIPASASGATSAAASSSAVAGTSTGSRNGGSASTSTAASGIATPASGSGSGSVKHGTTGYGHILTPTEVRILACDAQIIPAVLGSKGEVLDLGRANRLITPGLRDYLHARDKGCTYPGCSAPPSWRDGHHIIHWARGGPTDRENTTLLCRHHHTVVHRHDHIATVDDDGVHWTRRDGSPIGNTPREAWLDVA